MSLIADIQKALEMWPAWKRLTGLPDRVAVLEARLDALEGKPKRSPGKACPSCGEHELRVTESQKARGAIGRLGALERTYVCAACTFTEARVETP